MIENTRPVGILRYNAEVMRNNGAPQEVIAKYLKDNGSSFMQISAVPHPNDEQVARMLQSEKDGTFAAGKKTIADAAERIKKAESNTEKLAIAQGIFRGIGDGLLWGTADEIESAIMGAILCITIVGIPFGLQHFKIAKLALMPFGATVY